MRVPSWRIIILPARTVSPPNTLTPRRCPLLSRPLRELPPAFLCAILFSYLALTISAVDADDLERGLMLPVTSLAAVTLASLFLKNQYLLCFGLADNFSGDGGVLHQGQADFDIAI